MLFRPVAAGLMIVASLACANVARAEVTIALSINLTGLDPGARFVQPYCVGFGTERGISAVARGGLPFQPVTGGQFVRTVRFSMVRTEAVGGPVTEYACGVSVWGQRRDGVAYTFDIPPYMAYAIPAVTIQLSRRAWGMLGSSWSWPGDGPNTYHAVVAPIAKGPPPQYFSGGVFTPEQARALAEVEAAPVAEECPCGCGSGRADGAACSAADAKAVWDRLPAYEPTPPGGARREPPPSPPAPPPPAERSPAVITAESRRLGLDSARARAPITGVRVPGGRAAGTGTSIIVEAPPIFFRGTGDFVRYVW